MKFNHPMNTNLLRVLVLEPLQLLLCLLVVKLLTFKCRCHSAYPHLKLSYLRFRLRQTVNRKRKTLADYVRYRQVFEGVSGAINETHIPRDLVMANVTDEPRWSWRAA